MKKPFKYMDLEEWSTRFENSPTEEQIGCINALNAHNFECEFNLQDKEFVDQLIEVLYDTTMNIRMDDRVQVHAGWKTIQLLNPLKQEWNTMRSTLQSALMIIHSCDWKRDRSVQAFLVDFVDNVNPYDGPDGIGSFVNKLFGADQLHLLERHVNWVGHPLVIEWLMRSLAMPYGKTTVQEIITETYGNEEARVVEDPTNAVTHPATVETVKALLYHMSVAGDLNRVVREAVSKYVPEPYKAIQNRLSE